MFVLEGVIPPSPVAPRAKRSCAVFPPSSSSVLAKPQLSYSRNTKGKTLKVTMSDQSLCHLAMLWRGERRTGRGGWVRRMEVTWLCRERICLSVLLSLGMQHLPSLLMRVLFWVVRLDWCFGRPLDGKKWQGLSTSCAFLPWERDSSCSPQFLAGACRTVLLTSLEWSTEHRHNLSTLISPWINILFLFLGDTLGVLCY